MLSLAIGFVRSVIFCIFLGFKFWCFSWQLSCDFGKFCFSRCMSFQVVSLAFDLEMWRVSGKNGGSGELEREKQLRISALRKHKKKHVLTHTRFQARWWWKLETQSRSLAMLVFSWGYTCAFPGFCGNTSHMSRFLSAMCIDVEECGSTSSTHKRLQSLFMSLRGNTYVFTCSGSVKSRI